MTEINVAYNFDEKRADSTIVSMYSLLSNSNNSNIY
jgi:lipopolysaccharide biosynthesis glycosyltransferase